MERKQLRKKDVCRYPLNLETFFIIHLWLVRNTEISTGLTYAHQGTQFDITTWAVNSIVLRCNLQGQNTKTKNPSKPLNTVRDIKRTRREVKEVTWTDLLNQRSMFLAQIEVSTWHRRIDGVDWQDKWSLSCEIGTNRTKSIRTENDKIERKLS